MTFLDGSLPRELTAMVFSFVGLAAGCHVSHLRGDVVCCASSGCGRVVCRTCHDTKPAIACNRCGKTVCSSRECTAVTCSGCVNTVCAECCEAGRGIVKCAECLRPLCYDCCIGCYYCNRVNRPYHYFCRHDYCGSFCDEITHDRVCDIGAECAMDYQKDYCPSCMEFFCRLCLDGKTCTECKEIVCENCFSLSPPPPSPPLCIPCLIVQQHKALAPSQPEHVRLDALRCLQTVATSKNFPVHLRDEELQPTCDRVREMLMHRDTPRELRLAALSMLDAWKQSIGDCVIHYHDFELLQIMWNWPDDVCRTRARTFIEKHIGECRVQTLRGLSPGDTEEVLQT